MSGINGLRGTGDWSVDERPKDFRNTVLWLNPEGAAPIFAMSGRAKEKTVSDPEFYWWTETNAHVRLQLSAQIVAGDTTVTVDSTDPDSTTQSGNYGTATHLKPGDLLMVEPDVTTTVYNSPEYMMVTGVLSDTQFTVRRGAANTTPGTVANNAWLLLIGSAFAEGTAAPRAVTRNPVKYYNYTQIFKDTYELTGTAAKTEVRTGDPWSNDKKRKMFDHSRAIEETFLFAYKKYEETGENGKPRRYTAGFRGFVPADNTYAYDIPATLDDLMGRLEAPFRFTGSGDIGGNKRVVFTGAAGAFEMAKLIRAEDSVHMNLGSKITMWGMDFQELMTPFGTIMFKTHPLLSLHPVFKYSWYGVDFSAMHWAYLKGRNTKSKDDVQMDDEDLRRGFWQTEGGWMVDAGGMTQFIFDNVRAG